MKVLIVEDDKTISDGLIYTLLREGFQAESCQNYVSAVDRINQSVYDLYLLDLNLPDGNGYSLCQLIKKRYHAPVLFLTALEDEMHVVQGLDMGADDYITKPFRLLELISRMKNALRHYNKESSAQDMIQIKNITIHTKLAKVYKDGNEIILTSLEYKLLLTFVNNQGRILSRGQLMDSIWDNGVNFAGDNTLSVYIKRLREKLGDDSHEPDIIKTVRGLGYKMDKLTGV